MSGIFSDAVKANSQVDFPEPSVGSDSQKAFSNVIDALNSIFNENWSLDDIGGCLNGVSLHVNSMAQELIDGTDSKQIRISSVQAALALSNGVAQDGNTLVANATLIEDYIKNGSSKTPSTKLNS
jgi:hypothetical protein